MWPTGRSLAEAGLSALLLMGCLLSRITTRVSSVLLWLLGLCFLGYFFAVHTLPDEFFWQSVLGSNTTEAWEYAASYRPIDAALLLLWALPALLAVWHLWKAPLALQQRKLRILAWCLVGIWALWVAVGYAKGYSAYRIISRVDRVYPLAIAASWERYQKNAQFAQLKAELPSPANAPMVDVLVVVLGESASAHRWSLLGYQGHPTNAPLHTWQSGLVSLPLTTNGNNTGMTLPVLVAGQAIPSRLDQGVASYLDYAHETGFRKHVFANQQAPGFANTALRLRSDQHLQLQDGQLDEALTTHFQQALAQHQQDGQPAVITLHTYGSHPRVEKRSPTGLTDWHEPYDTSVFYTSQLLAQWIAQLDQLSPQRVALLYVSDHGQDFPVCGGSYSHGITRSTYEVPFLLWGNAALRHAQPQWWSQWQQLAAHALDRQGVPRFHTLLPAQAIQQLMGYAPLLPDTQQLPANGPYPPPEDASLCQNWTTQVQQLHPAAMQ